MLLSANSSRAQWFAHRLLFAAALAYACPAWAQFPGKAPVEGGAVIDTMNGRVDVMRDGAHWALSAGEWVKPGQMIVTGPDGWAMFKLDDGSTFEVFPNSQVSFRANRGYLRYLVELLLGNIKVHIQKLGGQPNPNKVRTPTALISVRGTIFDVKIEDNGDTTIVMVEEGLVDVEHLIIPGKAVSVHPGEAVHVYKNVALAQSRIDKGSAAQAIMRGIGQGLYEILLNRQRGAGGGSIPTSTGGSGGSVGDQRPANPPPPPPPPPTSAPPPPPGQ